MLREDGESDNGQLKVVSIVGFGGLGKTTLANQVYAKIKDEFQCIAFVSVSRCPNIPKILKDILSGVGYDSMNMLSDDVDKLIKALTEHLTDMRYTLSETTFV
jgi:molybdopterin-guanine dinucleotide biosynthesis protein